MSSQVTAMRGGGWVITVKPSAKPTLVRTQHLPPPGKTARDREILRVRGPSCVVSSCVIVGQETSLHHAGYGHIADRIKAGGAVHRTACSLVTADEQRACQDLAALPVGRAERAVDGPGRAMRRGRMTRLGSAVVMTSEMAGTVQVSGNAPARRRECWLTACCGGEPCRRPQRVAVWPTAAGSNQTSPGTPSTAAPSCPSTAMRPWSGSPATPPRPPSPAAATSCKERRAHHGPC
jgi:hypothetical protein